MIKEIISRFLKFFGQFRFFIFLLREKSNLLPTNITTADDF